MSAPSAPSPRPIFCKHCRGLLSAPRWKHHPLRIVRRLKTRLVPCHNPISLQNLSWTAAVHYGIIDRVPDEIERPFDPIGWTRVAPSVFTDRVIEGGPRWEWG